jgi:DNA repair protein RadC
LHGRARVKSYVAWLGQEAHEWLLALYVDDKLHLLAVDTVACGDVSSCRAPIRPIIVRAHQLGASGYILVHNHPSGDPTPSRADIEATVKLARVSSELGVPLLDHLIIAGDTMTSCGYF